MKLGFCARSMLRVTTLAAATVCCARERPATGASGAVPDTAPLVSIASGSTTPTDTAVPPSGASPGEADSAWNAPEATRLSGVQYGAPTQVFGTLGLAPSGEYFDSVGPGHKIGTFVDGRYRGADLVAAEWRTDEPCKGEGCGEPTFLRFVRASDTLVLLSQNSDAAWYFERRQEHWQAWTAAFAAAGLSLSADSQFAVAAFLPSDTMAYGSETFRLVSRRCGNASLAVAFLHPVFRSVRFDGQFFYVRRPDGSCLTFEYVPYFSEKEIVWDRPPHEPSRGGYSWRKGAEAGELHLRYDPFVTSDVVQLDRDATVVGHTPRGEPVYELKDPGHPLLRQFYDDYLKDFESTEEWVRLGASRESSGIQPPRRSYQEFLGARPIFLWRDPFGRLIRFTNNDFLPVYLAEPVIYVYPAVTQRVRVEARPLRAMTASTPLYRGGWEVMAQPSGHLTDVRDGKGYSFLFWEGFSSIAPMRREGFVVPSQEVAGFFQRMLPRLGLNERESQDFRDAWLPRFHGAPYYFITFLSEAAIDGLAPLAVTPKPDVVVRVLMDFRPLQEPERVTAPTLPAPPRRHGLTVVEWGGLRR